MVPFGVTDVQIYLLEYRRRFHYFKLLCRVIPAPPPQATAASMNAESKTRATLVIVLINLDYIRFTSQRF